MNPATNATPTGGQTFTVELAEAPRDVLVFLADRQAWFTAAEIAEAVAPADADTPESSVASALSLLSEMGLVLHGHGRWWVTRSGINAVAEARRTA